MGTHAVTGVSGLRHRGRAWGAAVLGCAALAGCAVFDDGKRDAPAQPLPAAFRNAEPAEDLPAPSSTWWTGFHSEELDRLVTTALASNHDLKVAVARVAQARAVSGVADSALYPTLNATGKYSVTAPSGGLGTAVDGVEWRSERLPQYGLSAAYELDLWGKNAYAAESALALARASVHYRDAVALGLVADVTKAYVDYLAESDRLEVSRRNLANSRNALEAVRTRLERGDATAVEVLQQETAVASAEGAVPVHTLNRERAFNKLAVLLGTTPAELKLSTSTLAALDMPKVAPGIPAQLICRRPDVRRAEDTLLSADADIRVARAKMYPDLSFSAEGGRAAYSFANLITPQAAFFSIIGQLTFSIFDAGKSSAQVEQNKARYEEMVATYRQTILQAVRDVEDSLAALRSMGDQQQTLARAVDKAKAAHDISARSYDLGAVDYLTLLETERTLFTNEDNETNIRAERLKALVDLYKALGGGTEAPACPQAKAPPAQG